MLKVFAILFSCLVLRVESWTCQGTSFDNAMSKCPDFGAQRFSAGGNVTVLVKRARKLANKDVFPTTSYLSDPYVEFIVGNSLRRRTRYIRNDLNPVWNEYVSLGMLVSGTEMRISIWDYDTGIEFGDDLINSIQMRVPFCSTFNASFETIDCGKPFNCESDDSLWKMPRRQICRESGVIDMRTGGVCGPNSGACLEISIEIVPFRMSLELSNPRVVTTAPSLSVMGPLVPAAIWTSRNGFGTPYLGSTIRLDQVFPNSRTLRGALMWRVPFNDRYKGRANDDYFYAAVNMPATIYVCRLIEDNSKGVPGWILKDFNDDNLTVTQLNINIENDVFGCFHRYTKGTKKNKWGGVGSEYLRFRTNTIAGRDQNDVLFYNYPYIILALPRVVVNPEEKVEILYDSAGFVQSFFQQGLICMWFMFITLRFLSRIKFRVDRVMTWFMTIKYSGDERHVFASLFTAIEHQSPSNVEFRAHLFHARNLVYFMYSIPFFLLISWGFSIASNVEPQSLGIGIAFVGMAALLFICGFRAWEEQKWRMSRLPLGCIFIATVLFFIFIISTVFVDPAVVLYNKPFDFTALGLVFGAINAIPLILLSFQRDRAFKECLKVLVSKMADALLKMKSLPDKPMSVDSSNLKHLSVSKALHGLLGPSYTLNPNVPAFNFASVLNDIAPTKSSSMKSGQRLYRSALLILFFYLMIAVARTQYPSLAFLNCLALILLDSVHTSISHGDSNWSPGYHIFLLVVGRLLIMGSSGHYWIFNYSLCFMVYSWSLITEIINNMLPMLTLEQAGEAVFVGNDVEQRPPNMDMAGTAQFSLGLLMYAFIAILLISAFAQPAELPVTKATVWGAEWYLYVFGLIACCFTVTCGLMSACVRAFYLDKHGLLRDWARNSYMLRKSIRLPLVLAAFTEVAIVSSGILIYGATRSAAILTLSVFVPPIVACFAYTYKVWVANDYDLIVWPPQEKTGEHVDDSPTDVEVAFNMIENIFGESKSGNQSALALADVGTLEEEERVSMKGKPSLKTLDNFQLAPLRAPNSQAGGPLDDNVKMPPLPLKSALRKKREAMGIKPVSQKQLIVMNEGNPESDSDAFGNGDVFLSPDDPWAEFEDAPEQNQDEEDDANEKTHKKSGERKGFFQSDFYVKITNKWSNSIIGKWCASQRAALAQFKKDRLKSYQPVEPLNELDREGDEENREGIDPTLDFDEEKLANAQGEGTQQRDDESLQGSLVSAHKVEGEIKNVSEMTFYYALMHGYLSSDEYLVLATWFGGMFLVLVMGCVLGAVVNPAWLGPTVWMGIWMFICAAVPTIKYFNTYVVDSTIKQFVYFAVFQHFMFCICFFGAVLDGDTGIHASLWLLDFFFFYPVIVYLSIELYIWVDNGFVIIPLDKDGDGDVTMQEYFDYFKFYPLFLCMAILLIWHFYDWIGDLVGNVAVLILLVIVIGYVFVRDWAANQFYLSSNLSFAGRSMINFILFITFLISLFSTTNPIFPLSVFFFTYIFKMCTKIASRYIVADSDTLIFFSPFVMPVFTYDPRRSDLVDETPVAKDFFQALIVGALWGAFLAMFLYPVSVGVGVACMFLLIIAAIVSATVSRVPLTLGRYSNLLSQEAIQSAANAAREKYDERKSPIDVTPLELQQSATAVENNEIKSKALKKIRSGADNGVNAAERAEAESRSAKLLGLQIREKTAIDIAAEQMEDSRALSYIRDDARAYVLDLAKQSKEEKVTWFTPYKQSIQRFMKYLSTPMGKMKGWVRHSEALFSFTDAGAEAIITGRGPLGFFGLEGLLFMVFQAAKKHPRLKFLDQPWLATYDEHANRLNASQLTESFETSSILRRFFELDDSLDTVAFEEVRCGAHFLMLLTLAGQSRLKREQVLVQKFFRENRFRLASNGISPPSQIFSSSSYASIDIPLVAVWLSTLSPDERDRFHSLKVSFSEEQTKRDESVDDEDYQFQLAARDLSKSRKVRELEMLKKVKKEILARQGERVRNLMDYLSPEEKTKFLLKKDVWMKNADVIVYAEDVELYAKFRAAVMQHSDEATDFARAALAEIESASKDCRIGDYGRNYQFVDPEFPPGDGSLGPTAARAKIQNWRCAPGINEQVRLFEDGTDPDDVDVGVFDTDWLLSAISMLAAAGGVGDGGVDEQVANLFIGHYALDGDITFQTEVGGYCVRLFKNGLWTPIVLDDMFPMLKDMYWTNDNKGIATAHSKECSEIWVALIEKAFAKYYGSYAAIEKGFVHHALQDLTGCEAECITLANAARGPGKRDMWDKILRFRKNGYLLGAGTGSSSLVDKEILDMGIVFNACYVVYDAQAVDGHQLLKLRNPPGNHEEWRGDWSDKSDLWSKRLKKKLSWTDEDDNTFWMSFDDFCNVFRNLYVCRWYDKNKWKSKQFSGQWKRSEKRVEAEAQAKQKAKDEAYARNQDGGAAVDVLNDEIADPNAPEMSDEDTAGGLPSAQNPKCVLENNPHYQIRITRPTDLRITLAQADSRGVANEAILPVSMFLLKPLAKKDYRGRLPRVTSFNKDELIEFTGPPKQEITMHMYVSLLPGDYIIMAACYMSGTEGHFTLSLLSNYKVPAKQIWPTAIGGIDEDELHLIKKQELIERNTKLMMGAKARLSNVSSKLLGDKTADPDDDDPFNIANIKDEDIDVEAPKKGSMLG